MGVAKLIQHLEGVLEVEGHTPLMERSTLRAWMGKRIAVDIAFLHTSM